MTNKLVKLGKLVQLVKSGMKGFTPFALGIIIIGLTIAGLMGKFPQKTEAVWYDDLFAYRRAIRFGNTGATVTDQKVLIAMNTSSTSGLIQDERMQTDCDDTRFTNANGLPLQYYINVGGGAGVGCNDASTDYYVLMPRIEGGGDTLIYLYYGNYNAVSASAAANFSQTTFSPTSGPSTAAEEIGTAPVLYWNFDEGYGTTANDLMIQRNNGTITGSWATDDLCVSGKCLQFNGSSHKVIKTYASDFELDVSSNSFTVSLWMRHASALAGTDTLVSRVSSGGYKIAASSGSFCFAIDDDASTFDPDDSACTTSTYNDSTWHQVTAVKNGTTSITLYVDGNQVAQDASLTGTGSISGSSPEFDVGVDGSSNFFDGFIDEVKVYNTAKTASQITAEYSSRSATGEGTASQTGSNQLPLSNGLVGYWTLDSSSASGGIADFSGNDTTLTRSSAVANNPELRAFKFSNGADYESGNSDYHYDNDNAALSVTGDLTLSAWIKPESVTADTLFDIVGKFDGATESYQLAQFGDEIRMYVDSANGYATTLAANLAVSTSYHVAGVYESRTQTVSLYVNGEYAPASVGGAIPSSIGDDTARFHIGAEDSSGTAANFYDGFIDEVRIYSRALSPEQIRQLANFAPGPVGWWKMDENIGTSANDTSGNGNTGTLTNSPVWAPGKVGQGIYFDGSSSNRHVNIPDNTNINFNTSDNFSVSVWEKIPVSQVDTVAVQNMLMEKWAVSGAYPFVIRIYNQSDASNGKIAACRYDGTNNPCITSAKLVNDNAWHHLEFVKDGSTLRLYIDGVQDNTTTDTTTAATTNTSPLFVGIRNANANPVIGTLDDLKIYNYARTGKQIVEDMLGGRSSVTSGGPNAGQTIYWKFDEQQGTTANNAVEEPGTGSLDGTVTGADWRLPENNCKVNGCLTFSTATDDVSAGDEPFTDSLTAMTVSLWVSPTTLATSKGIVSKSNFGAGSSFAITTGSTNTEIRVFVASATSSDENYFTTTDFSLTTSSFSHLAMVYDGALPASERVKVYKDGRRTSGSVTGTIPTSMVASSTANLTAGESASTSYQALDSHMDEVKIYKFALTQSEVLVDANAGSAAAFGGVLGVPGGTPHDSEGFGGNPPVGWWKMDENTGTSAVDSSGNGLTGTLNNGPIWTTGRSGSSLDFDSTNDSVSVSDNSLLKPVSVTVMAWVKLDSLTANTICDGASTSSPYIVFKRNTRTTDFEGYSLQKVTNTFSFYLASSGGTANNAVSTTIPTVGNWTHVAGTFERPSIKIYINGVLEGTATHNFALNYGTRPLFIGRSGECGGGGEANYDSYFNGSIDDVRIYNYARTAAQIAYDYNRGAAIGWWKLDECQGNTAFDSSLKPGPSTVDMSGAKPGNISFGASGNTAFGTCGSGTTTEMWNNGTTGKMNASLDVDGTDDVVTVANDLAIDMDVGLSNGFTISAWINAATAGESNVGQIWNKGTNTYCRTDNPSGSDLDIECNLDLATTDANVNVSAGATTGGWYHVAMTYDDASKITVYINGKNRGTNTGSGATAADTSSLLIGGPSTANFDGQIDDVRIHAYEMTAAQVRRLYNEGAAIRFGPQSGSP